MKKLILCLVGIFISTSIFSQQRGIKVAIGFGNSVQNAQEASRDEAEWLNTTYEPNGQYGATSRFTFVVDGQTWDCTYYVDDGELFFSRLDRVIIYDFYDGSKATNGQLIFAFKARSLSAKYTFIVMYVDSPNNNDGFAL